MKKNHGGFKLRSFEVKLLEIDCRFWKGYAHLKPLEIANIIRYLTEGVQFTHILNSEFLPLCGKLAKPESTTPETQRKTPATSPPNNKTQTPANQKNTEFPESAK